MGGSSKTESSNKVDPELMALYRQNYTKANEIADLPYQPYGGERVAGFNQAQLQGQNALLGAASDPTALNAIRGAQGTVGSLLDYHPAAITPPGSLGAQTVSAPNIFSPGALSAPSIAAPSAISAQSISASPVAAQRLADTDLSPYFNPYLDQVVNASLADLSYLRDQQRVKDNATATAARAFGGTRQAVQDSLTSSDYLRNAANTSANLRSAGFNNAQNAALADIAQQTGVHEFNAGQDLAAQTTNAGNRLSADTFNTSLLADIAKTNAGYRFNADQYNLTNAFNLAKTNADYGFGADQYNAAAGTAADQYNLNNALNIAQMNAGNDLAGANFRLNAANQYAGLGNIYFNQLAQQGNLYSAIGAQQQAMQQTQDDAAYEEFMRQLQYPYQQQQLRNQAVTMMPLQQTQTQTNSSSPGVLDVLNVAANGLKAAKPSGF
jgi:hypothetical protein